MIDLTGVPNIPAPQVRQDVLDAIAKAKKNLPTYPRKLLKELGAFMGKSRNWGIQGKPNLKPWDWQVSGCWNGYVPNNVGCSLEDGYIPYDFDPSNIGYVAIWRARVGKSGKIAYCVLPSMTSGIVDPGGTIEVGEPLRIGWKQDEVDAMVRKGHDLMMKLIAVHGEFEGKDKE